MLRFSPSGSALSVVCCRGPSKVDMILATIDFAAVLTWSGELTAALIFFVLVAFILGLIPHGKE